MKVHVVAGGFYPADLVRAEEHDLSVGANDDSLALALERLQFGQHFLEQRSKRFDVFLRRGGR
jgi:hypothetical protein